MTDVAVLHPGRMGAALGRALIGNRHRAMWRPDGRGEATRSRAEAAGLVPVTDLDGVDVVISICPPDAAEATARSVAGFGGLYLDANAISPATARRVAAVVGASGASYVDGSVIGAPPTGPAASRLYLSGAEAATVAALFAGSTFEPIVIDQGGVYAASGLKMAYGSWSKINQALLIAARATAEELGLGPVLAAEWARSDPEALDGVRVAQAGAAVKGWRWQGEMAEIARTAADLGQPDGFARAAASIYARYPRPAD